MIIDYTFEQLNNMENKTLVNKKEDLQEELYKAQKERYQLIKNILWLQSEIRKCRVDG